MKELTELEPLFESRTIKPTFEYVHVLLSLFIFGDNSEGIGRYRLEKELQIGSGTAKSLYKKLKENIGFITVPSEEEGTIFGSQRKGHVLTEKGHKFLTKIKKKIPLLAKANLDFLKEIIIVSENVNPYFCLVKDAVKNINDGIEQRDAAIKINGSGATCLIYNGNDLYFPSKISNINELVTHNTAILGILGVGKSMLAIELVERMIASGIKVICLDLTNQYAKELGEFYVPDYEEGCLQALQAASEKDREAFSNNPEEGGSLPNLSQAIYDDLVTFLDPGNPRKLKIYNPSSFVATKHQREPSQYKEGNTWHRGAGLFTVTPVEITKIISEASLDILSDEMTDKARACLVYEEAHSLVPEWNSVVNEGDKNATSGTARAILQGRKYGLGCLLITQRTANVTKTILNQCNSIFAMRTFDETGKEFLANYVGRDYASALSSIPERHAVFFGKASSCENPVLIRLNDQDHFRQVFRAEYPPAQLPQNDAVEEVQEEQAAQDQADPDFNDEIPF